LTREEEQESFKRLRSLEREMISILTYTRFFELKLGTGFHEKIVSDHGRFVEQVMADADLRSRFVSELINPLGARLKFADSKTVKAKHEVYQSDLEFEEQQALMKVKPLLSNWNAQRDAFVESNFRLVIAIAKKYSSFSMPLMDRVSFGNQGLIIAVDRFDLSHGTKFSTYAIWWIRQAIYRGMLGSVGVVRLPPKKAYLLKGIARFRNAFSMKHHRRPTQDEVAAALGTKVEVIRAVDAVLQTYELDRSVIEGPGAEGMLDHEVVKPKERAGRHFSLAREELREQIIYHLRRMASQRTRDVLWHYYGLGGGEPMTLESLRQFYFKNISRQRIQQILRHGEGQLVYRILKESNQLSPKEEQLMNLIYGADSVPASAANRYQKAALGLRISMEEVKKIEQVVMTRLPAWKPIEE
jgi:DNA-directed RNA polymerase sigma subunit (sigma70/sigma32)